MAQPFPQHENLVGGFAPIQMESDYPDLVVEGEIPKELQGVFYRNGPNPQYSPRGGNYHFFAGDGMIHGFYIKDGQVAYKNRYVQTIKWEKEREAGRALFSAFNPMDSDESVAGMQTDGLANTNVIYHGGKLLALEEAHAPFEIDPMTLESKGSHDFGGKLVGPMTAHPKIDPENGEMIFFGYNADGMISEHMSFHVVDKDGNLVRSETFKAPYASMVHDFMVTREHVIFPIMPLTGSLERAMNGGPVYAWEPEKGVHIGIMPRQGSVNDIRWFRGEPSFMFHPMNAYTEGDIVTCDVCEFEMAPLFPWADGTPGDASKAIPRLTRWTFDMGQNSDDYKTERLDDIACEFPRLDERFTATDYRYGYMAADTNPAFKVGGFNAIGRRDHQTGKLELHDVGEGCATNEPIFVPRSETAEEGEGFLLANIYDANRDASHLLVLDAQNVEGEPLAKAYLNHRIPFGFHGNWAPIAL
ncbi:MAG: carotenoid oxygenase family protein [Pseudomonadales bacterium]|nr:carotenoid oxygenase family protein [Pseudomonadales bacterium]MBO6564320.1 carotenoid oxygenase family protein [Pseudomonadales bacterium]MBO6594933.1 carotenoid oxygenase family protein [Pseudomonadales bacterium]MBO6658267.1 carotenoid oxygenase family protein [Pseudomonadales bacterium]MBO6701438.1 carotenoid oxygenase family protein [Pseudomonadales bacterium]